MHRDPGIDRIWIGRSCGIAAGCRSRPRRSSEAEADDERTAALEHVTTRENQIGRKRFDFDRHRVSPAILVDASLIACITRG